MKRLLSFMLVLGLALVLAACGGSDDSANDAENTDTDNDTTEESEGMIPETIVMGFVPSQDSDTIADTVEPLAERLGEELGVEVQGQVMTNYTALVEAMGSNQVHIGFIPAFGYVQAKEEYDIEVILKSIRHGSDTYKAQY